MLTDCVPPYESGNIQTPSGNASLALRSTPAGSLMFCSGNHPSEFLSLLGRLRGNTSTLLPMELCLQLHHHLTHQKFVLIKEGDDWRQEFDSLEKAMATAAKMVDGNIPVLVLDEAGSVVSESSIHTARYRGTDGSAPL